jgi:hypothetical protein
MIKPEVKTVLSYFIPKPAAWWLELRILATYFPEKINLPLNNQRSNGLRQANQIKSGGQFRYIIVTFLIYFPGEKFFA